jgi:hypothetical protein
VLVDDRTVTTVMLIERDAFTLPAQQPPVRPYGPRLAFGANRDHRRLARGDDRAVIA